MFKKKTERNNKIKELRRLGKNTQEICEALGISRTDVYNYSRILKPIIIIPEGMHQCLKCKEIKSIGEFTRNKEYKDKLGWCHSCNAEHQRIANKRSRDKFLKMYGGRCVCCGETTYEFLAIDHINGLEGKERKKSCQNYRDATTHYSPEKYRILCHNCNMAHGIYGYCPHNKGESKDELSSGI